MPQFKLHNGKLLDSHSHAVATVKGDAIINDHSHKIATIHHDAIKNDHSHTIATVRGDKIFDEHSHKIGTIKDVCKDIGGATGTMTDVALWVMFITH